jgi:hypothetical protein
MTETAFPFVNIALRPIFDRERASAIRVDLSISEPNVGAGQVLLTGFAGIIGVELNLIQNDAIQALDDFGDLPLEAKDTPIGPPVIPRHWVTQRATKGNVRAWYIALPRVVSATTRDLPSFDLREDQNGLFSSGYGFLNLPAGNQGQHLIKLRWNLEDAPLGTRAVWTFGRGEDEVIRRDTVSGIQQTFFAVGPLKSEESILDPSTGLTFGMYWFGDPPFNATKVANTIKSVFGFMSKFFDDDERSYRVFLRHNPYFGYGAGTALKRSFMFGWDDSDLIQPPSEESQVLFLAHEMVHNWANLDSSAPQYENWYSEGLAEYYSLTLLYRGGFISRAVLFKQMNRKLLSYYTNSLVNLSNQEVSKITWQTSDAQTLPYGRGFTFAIQINYLISAATKGKNSLDDVVLEMLYRRRNGQPAGIPTYISLLADYLGEESANKLYEDMSAGHLVTPSLESLAEHDFRLERSDEDNWDLGFDEVSLNGPDRIVKGLKAGSHAENAGLQNGDRIMNTVRLRELQEQSDAVMRLIARRGPEKEIEVRFRPRGTQKVESYRYIDLKGRNW